MEGASVLVSVELVERSELNFFSAKKDAEADEDEEGQIVEDIRPKRIARNAKEVSYFTEIYA